MALGFERLVVQRGRGSHRHPKSQHALKGRPFRVVAQAPATGLEDGAWSPVKFVSFAISYGTAEKHALHRARSFDLKPSLDEEVWSSLSCGARAGARSLAS